MGVSRVLRSFGQMLVDIYPVDTLDVPGAR